MQTKDTPSQSRTLDIAKVNIHIHIELGKSCKKIKNGSYPKHIGEMDAAQGRHPLCLYMIIVMLKTEKYKT